MSLLFLIMIFAVVNPPSISVWAFHGVALRRLLGDVRMVRMFDIAMALLQVGSMITLLLGSLLA